MKSLSVIISFVVFAICLAAGPIILTQFGHGSLLIPQFWGVFAFVTGLTFVAIAAVLIGQRINPDYFAQYFLVATVVKLLACLVFLVFFMLHNHINKRVFMANFLYLYFLNTVFEIYVLLRKLRNQNLK